MTYWLLCYKNRNSSIIIDWFKGKDGLKIKCKQYYTLCLTGYCVTKITVQLLLIELEEKMD